MDNLNESTSFYTPCRSFPSSPICIKLWVLVFTTHSSLKSDNEFQRTNAGSPKKATCSNSTR